MKSALWSFVLLFAAANAAHAQLPGWIIYTAESSTAPATIEAAQKFKNGELKADEAKADPRLQPPKVYGELFEKIKNEKYMKALRGE